MTTIEERVAETLLQDSTKVTIGGVEYSAAPPSIATLAVVSSLISLLPQRKLDKNNVVQESLSIAERGPILGEIAAVLILGARVSKERVKVQQTQKKRYLFGLIRMERSIETESTKMKQLADEINDTLTPAELHALVANLLRSMNLGDFFALSTFLVDVNLLRAKKVEN